MENVKNYLVSLLNPFRPGAGHLPPYLAGRQKEIDAFDKLLGQGIITDNVVLTGLRGVGKTVLLEHKLKPLALSRHWRWVGNDLSETVSMSENNLAIRILTDLSLVTSDIIIAESERQKIGFLQSNDKTTHKLDYTSLERIYSNTAGLSSDKLKFTLEMTWYLLKKYDGNVKGIIFAYDEAQLLADHAEKEQYPLSLLLDVFQSLQKKGIPFMLVLTGLPTLFSKLVEARTYAERMFTVLNLGRLQEKESSDAIIKPFEESKSGIRFTEETIQKIITLSSGYPYFIQFICREAFDSYLQMGSSQIPIDAIMSKLDIEFFSGRWFKMTDRQRELMAVIAALEHGDEEFTVQEIADKSKILLANPFSSSHINQMLWSLSNSGLVYKNRHGKYSFAVPLMAKFIQRQRHLPAINQ